MRRAVLLLCVGVGSSLALVQAYSIEPVKQDCSNSGDTVWDFQHQGRMFGDRGHEAPSVGASVPATSSA